MDLKRIKSALRIAILAPACIHAVEDYGTWSHQARLRLDTSPTGADISGPVYGFPLLVRLKGGEFPFSEALKQGEDIRFANAGGQPLAYQIERWDSAGAAAEIWVRLDTVQGGNAKQAIHMYWGKAGVADNSNGSSVFGASNGYVAAWHLGGAGWRPNAVAGGQQAIPKNYQGNESVTGMIGLADSLGGGDPGAYLDIGDGYTEFTAGFTFSAWLYSPVADWYSHIFDLGNGKTSDNIVLQRVELTQTAAFDNYRDSVKSNSVHIDSILLLNRWQYCTVTVQGKNFKYYVNGSLVLADTLSIPIDGVYRTENFLGKSNWAGDWYFQGIYDEVNLAKIDRNADWVKLSYASQRPDQNLLTFLPGPDCVPSFSIAGDTTVAEGIQLRLAGMAACASSHSWSAVDGPAPRVLDPDAETLLVIVPRVAKDTSMRYQFSADYGDSSRNRYITVHILNSVPDPVFTLPASITWNGRDSLAIKPILSNLAEIMASAAPTLHYQWTLGDSQSTDTALDPTPAWANLIQSGEIQIGLCLDNGGAPLCKTTRLFINASATALAAKASGKASAAPRNLYDTRGRKVDPIASRRGARFAAPAAHARSAPAFQ